MSIIANRKRHAITAPEVERGPAGSVLWPSDTREAFYQLCDLARVAPDTLLNTEQLKERLWEHGEATKRTTVEHICEAMRWGWQTWR